jgi:5'-nucleotidase
MKRIYIDMDGVLCDYMSDYLKYKSDLNPFPQSRVDFFRNLKPIEGSIESFKILSEHYDVWILTRPSVKNPLCYTEKRIWVENYLGEEACDKLIISPDKSLLKGDYLIDDMPIDNVGNVQNFEGEFIHFGSDQYPNWSKVLEIF